MLVLGRTTLVYLSKRRSAGAALGRVAGFGQGPNHAARRARGAAISRWSG